MHIHQRDIWLFENTLLGQRKRRGRGGWISSQLKIRGFTGITGAKITESHYSFKDRTEPTIRIYCAAAARDACGYKIFHEIHRKWVGSENHFTTHISDLFSLRWLEYSVGCKYSSNYWRTVDVHRRSIRMLVSLRTQPVSCSTHYYP